jgi:hypothetical protein
MASVYTTVDLDETDERVWDSVIDVDLKALEGKMESLGAPWTPGRVPVWKE